MLITINALCFRAAYIIAYASLVACYKQTAWRCALRICWFAHRGSAAARHCWFCLSLPVRFGIDR